MLHVPSRTNLITAPQGTRPWFHAQTSSQHMHMFPQASYAMQLHARQRNRHFSSPIPHAVSFLSCFSFPRLDLAHYRPAQVCGLVFRRSGRRRLPFSSFIGQGKEFTYTTWGVCNVGCPGSHAVTDGAACDSAALAATPRCLAWLPMCSPAEATQRPLLLIASDRGSWMFHTGRRKILTLHVSREHEQTQTARYILMW